ncbi:MAG: cohesin domain-containing protein [Nitrospira sp.]|nr:cohesin domain-containing protein [Nitrospira sp.]
MKTIWYLALVLGLIFFGSSSAHAISLEFVPPTQQVDIGDTFEVEIVILDLVDSAPPSLGTFDLDVIFDPTILSFSSVTYGDPVLGDQLDLFGLGSITATTPGTGSVNFFELSLDSAADLNNLQAGDFTLATLTFDTFAKGNRLKLPSTASTLRLQAGNPVNPVYTLLVSTSFRWSPL